MLDDAEMPADLDVYAKRLAEGLEDIKQGRVIGPFKNAKEAVRALRSKD